MFQIYSRSFNMNMTFTYNVNKAVTDHPTNNDTNEAVILCEKSLDDVENDTRKENLTKKTKADITHDKIFENEASGAIAVDIDTSGTNQANGVTDAEDGECVTEEAATNSIVAAHANSGIVEIQEAPKIVQLPAAPQPVLINNQAIPAPVIHMDAQTLRNIFREVLGMTQAEDDKISKNETKKEDSLANRDERKDHGENKAGNSIKNRDEQEEHDDVFIDEASGERVLCVDWDGCKTMGKNYYAVFRNFRKKSRNYCYCRVRCFKKDCKRERLRRSNCLCDTDDDDNTEEDTEDESTEDDDDDDRSRKHAESTPCRLLREWRSLPNGNGQKEGQKLD